MGPPQRNRHCDPLTRRCGCDFGFLDVRGECVSEMPQDYIDRRVGYLITPVPGSAPIWLAAKIHVASSQYHTVLGTT